MSRPSPTADQLQDVRSRTPSLVEGDIDYGLLADLTGFSLKLVWVLGHSLLSCELDDVAVTPHRFSVLEVISCNPGLQQTQLASALALTRPATTLAVDFWEQRGCVERRKVPGDRRASSVYVTLKGEQELNRLRVQIRKADVVLTSGLTGNEIETLRKLLKKIHQ